LLHDILVEILSFDNSYYDEVQKVSKIVKKWGEASSELFRDLHRNGFKFHYQSNILPENDLYNKKLLSGSSKKDLLGLLDEIIEMQDGVFSSLARKLKIE